MHAFIENTTSGSNRSDCPIKSLSWMCHIPDELSDLNVSSSSSCNNYDYGWLAMGNSRGIVGVTFTSSYSKKETVSVSEDTIFDQPSRTNFYLRGHRSEVMLVKWNAPFQKLATCDITGIIFVWIKHGGRWSIELINDRSSQVTDFSWSHDGQMALICYQDSFVLVGSVAGQRYWSSVLSLDSSIVTCGIWSEDDQKVMFGTTGGKIIVMSAGGAMLAQVVIHNELEVASLAWSCPKFTTQLHNFNIPPFLNNSILDDRKISILSVILSDGEVLLMTGYDDLSPKVVHSGLTRLNAEWSNDGELLAIVGWKSTVDLSRFNKTPKLSKKIDQKASASLPSSQQQLGQGSNELKFYRRFGKLQFCLALPSNNQKKNVATSLTWGHDDQRLFIAIGLEVLTVWISKEVASLQLLSQATLQLCLQQPLLLPQLPLPTKILNSLSYFFQPTIKGYVPYPGHLRDYVCSVPPPNHRLHCTIIRHGVYTDSNVDPSYTLYLEHMGGLIPLLRGRRASKLHPDFIIFDPEVRTKVLDIMDQSMTSHISDSGEDSDFDVMQLSDLMGGTSTDCYGDEISSSVKGECSSVCVEEASNQAASCSSPSIRKHTRLRKLKESLKCRDASMSALEISSLAEQLHTNELATHADHLPELHQLVCISSNLWGTRFRFHGSSPYLPEDLGSVTYKTSLLHLHPRQMTVAIIELPPRDVRLAEGDRRPSEVSLTDHCNPEEEFISCQCCKCDSMGPIKIQDLSNSVTSSPSHSPFKPLYSPFKSLAHKARSRNDTSCFKSPSRTPKSQPKTPKSPKHQTKIVSEKTSNCLKQSKKKHKAISTTSDSQEALQVSRRRLSTGLVLKQMHIGDLCALQDDRLTRVSPTETDPLIEYFLCSGTSQQFQNNSDPLSRLQFGFLRTISTNPRLALTPHLDEDDAEQRRPISWHPTGRSNQHRGSLFDIREGLSREDTLTDDLATPHVEDIGTVGAEDIQFMDDDEDCCIDLYERQSLMLNSNESGAMSAREIMLKSAKLFINDSMFQQDKDVLIVDEVAEASDGSQLDAETKQPSRIIMTMAMCNDNNVIEQIQHSFEPCKIGMNEDGNNQSLHLSSSAHVKIREMARNALCIQRRTKRRFFPGWCSIANPEPLHQSSVSPIQFRNKGNVDDRSSDSSNQASPINSGCVKHLQQRCGSLDATSCDIITFNSSKKKKVPTATLR